MRLTMTMMRPVIFPDLDPSGVLSHRNLATLRDELGLGEDEDIPEDDLEEAKEEAFEQWKDEYVASLPEDELIAFLERFFNAEVENDVNEYDFTIEIPEEIVDMAK